MKLQGANMIWSNMTAEERIIACARLALAGASYSQIAVETCCASKNVIAGFFHRHQDKIKYMKDRVARGEAVDAAPAVLSSFKPTTRPFRRAKKESPAAAAATAGAVQPAPPVTPPRSEVREDGLIPPPKSALKTRRPVLILVRPDRCKFPLWSNRERTPGPYQQFVCGSPTKGEGPYCAEHHELCHSGVVARGDRLTRPTKAVDAGKGHGNGDRIFGSMAGA